MSVEEANHQGLFPWQPFALGHLHMLTHEGQDRLRSKLSTNHPPFPSNKLSRPSTLVNVSCPDRVRLCGKKGRLTTPKQVSQQR